MEARLDLAKQLRLSPGPDLGFQEKSENISYLPAYQRYDGVIYQTGEVRQRYIGFGGHLIILSALYGLLEASDTIRNYDLAMNDSLPMRTRVYTFWQKHGLREIIEEYYHACESATLHDLLSGNYRKALEPWPTLKINRYHPYNYPGLRTASNYPRGGDLKRLLSH
jgi:cytoplasmic iron level regulating protein YaaA (DUF328/UPF0246 family)